MTEVRLCIEKTVRRISYVMQGGKLLMLFCAGKKGQGQCHIGHCRSAPEWTASGGRWAFSPQMLFSSEGFSIILAGVRVRGGRSGYLAPFLSHGAITLLIPCSWRESLAPQTSHVTLNHPSSSSFFWKAVRVVVERTLNWMLKDLTQGSAGEQL